MICPRNQFTLATLALALSSCASSVREVPCGDASFTYRFPPEDSIGINFHGNHWSYVNRQNAPPADASSSLGGTKRPLELGGQMMGCSTADYRCVRTSRLLFAAPVAGLIPHSSFSIVGAEVKVLDCMEFEDGKCNVALLISDCRSDDKGHTKRGQSGAIDPSNCRSTGWGLQVMYIYSRNRGVIGFTEAEWWSPETGIVGWELAKEGVPEGMYGLVEERGLLSCLTP